MGKAIQILKRLGEKYMELGYPGKDGKPTKAQKAITYIFLPSRIASDYIYSQTDERQNNIRDNVRDKLGLNTNSTTKVASIPGYTKEAITKYGNTN